MNTFLLIIECIGVISFSISATIVAVKKKTDAVGALIFTMLTCFGGGILRDLCLSAVPHLFWDREYYLLACICMAVCLICFHLCFIKKISDFLERHKHTLLIELTDAVGLSVFCIFGVEAASNVTDHRTTTLLIFCGCITGVGGGILRDLLSAEIPFVFRKHIYVIPSALGSALYTLTQNILPQVGAMLLSIGLIILIRVLAILFHWNLPVPGGKQTD